MQLVDGMNNWELGMTMVLIYLVGGAIFLTLIGRNNKGEGE